MTRVTLAAKLKEIGRRSPKHLAAIETIVNFALQSLDSGAEHDDPKPYHWTCDDPKPKKRGA
jgi:hypothetical protein